MEISEGQRKAIVAMHNSNTSARDIARMLNISRPTVYRWIHRSLETEDLTDKKRSGRPRFTTPEVDNAIIKTAQQQPITTAVAIKQQIQCNIGVQAVRKRLHASGIHHRSPAVKPGLTQAHKDDRLGFALEYFSADYAFWSRVIFCDEKTFSTDACEKQHCWRRTNTR